MFGGGGGGGARLVMCVTFDLLDLHPVLMFFARVAIAQGCVCIGVVGYIRHNEEQKLIRPQKRL